MTDRVTGWCGLCVLLALGAGRALAADGCAQGAVLGPPAFAVDAGDPSRHGSALFVAAASGAAVRGGLERFALRADGAVVDAGGALATDAAGRIGAAAIRDWPADVRPAPLYTDLVLGSLRAAASRS